MDFVTFKGIFQFYGLLLHFINCFLCYKDVFNLRLTYLYKFSPYYTCDFIILYCYILLYYSLQNHCQTYIKEAFLLCFIKYLFISTNFGVIIYHFSLFSPPSKFSQVQPPSCSLIILFQTYDCFLLFIATHIHTTEYINTTSSVSIILLISLCFQSWSFSTG